MQNKQLRKQIDGVLNSLKGLKATEIEEQIEISKQIVQALIGANEIQKIRNSSLLKLLVYELIIFSDQKSKCQDVPTARMLNQFSRVSEKMANPLNSIKQLKRILSNIGSRNKLTSTQAKLSISQLKDIVKRINFIEEQLLKEEENRRKSVITNVEDEDGMELMVEQLESLLKKKQNRIKELNNQLEQNFQDKHQLEAEIIDLQQQNRSLAESVRLLEEQSCKLKDQLEKFKNRQKDDFLMGATDFMNISFPHKPLESVRQINISVAGNQENQMNELNQMSQSTKCLSKYFNHVEETQQTSSILPKKQEDTQQKTIKKCQPKSIRHQISQLQDENLLQSMRIFKASPSQNVKIENDDHVLERMLLIQASFIEKAMQAILN